MVELVDTKHLNCFSPNRECGFDSRPDYKFLNMQYLHLYVVVIIAVVSTAFVYYSNRKHEKSADAQTTIRLGRLLHYRDKAKLLDDFMNKRINPKKLSERYEDIERANAKFKALSKVR